MPKNYLFIIIFAEAEYKEHNSFFSQQSYLHYYLPGKPNFNLYSANNQENMPEECSESTTTTTTTTTTIWEGERKRTFRRGEGASWRKRQGGGHSSRRQTSAGAAASRRKRAMAHGVDGEWADVRGISIGEKVLAPLASSSSSSSPTPKMPAEMLLSNRRQQRTETTKTKSSSFFANADSVQIRPSPTFFRFSLRPLLLLTALLLAAPLLASFVDSFPTESSSSSIRRPKFTSTERSQLRQAFLHKFGLTNLAAMREGNARDVDRKRRRETAPKVPNYMWALYEKVKDIF